MINKLLAKDPKKRINIKQALDHKWVTMQDQEIRELRRKSQDMNDAVLQFVAYSNVNVDKVKENSPRAAAGFNASSLASKADASKSNFMQQMQAKKEAGGAGPQLGGGGLFGKGQQKPQ